MEKNTERKIETSFFREDFRRVPMSEIGAITTVGESVVDRYRAAFVKQCDRDAIAAARGRAVVDYGLGSTSAILPTLLAEVGAGTITVNAATSAAYAMRTPTQHEQDLRQLAAMCRAIGASVGAMMDNDGKTVSLVDDQGNIVDPMTALAAFAVLAWRATPGAQVAVPLTAPLMFDHLAEKYGGSVQRVQANPQAQMRTADLSSAGGGEGDLVLVGDGDGSYVIPSFHPGFDGMMAVARLLQYLGMAGVRLSEVLSDVPSFHLASVEVQCPWDLKGRVMRGLHERASQQSAGDGTQIDGVKFDLGTEWAVVLPDPDRPLFQVWAESSSPEHASALAEKYVELIRRLEK
jgi:mannose-1-phosphate guanylyltransferase/phosphomannomutase